MINDGGTFKSHFPAVVTKTVLKVSKLSRILPNVGGPADARRAVLCNAMQNILFYGAPIWYAELRLKKYRTMLGRVQRKVLRLT